MVELEGRELTPSHKNSKITTNCWTTIDKKDWKLPKKIFYIERQRRSHNKMVGGALSWYNPISYLPVGQPTNWKIIVSQRFSHWSESSQPHVRLPILRVWNREEEPPEHFALKASVAWVQELHRTGGNRDSTLGGCTQGFTCTGTQGKAVTPQEPGPGLPASPGCSPGEMGVNCGSLWGQGHWWWRPQRMIIGVISPGGHHFGTETQPHSTVCRLQCWDTSGQTTNRVGTQPHPSADRLPKVILSHSHF